MATDTQSRTFLHPASGGIILALDWVLFSGSILSLGFGTPALASTGFVLGTLGVTFVQRRFGHDTLAASVFKGVLSGAVVGIPLPVAGTTVGGLVLALSGLNRWKKRLRPRRGARQDESAPPS